MNKLEYDKTTIQEKDSKDSSKDAYQCRDTHIRTQRNSIKTQTESHNIYTKTCKAGETKQNRTSWCNIMRKKNGQRWH